MTSELIAFYPLYPFMAFAGLTFFAVIIYALCFAPSRSKVYRQDLSNMYVIGKIKQIAKKEGIDLNVEFAEFAKVTKNKKIDLEALDMTVERELQEKLADKVLTNKGKAPDKK